MKRVASQTNRFFTSCQSLICRLILSVGMVLLVSILIWAFFDVRLHKGTLMKKAVIEGDRLADTVKLGTHYAMMLNSRSELDEIVRNIGRLERIRQIRIYNKEGEIKFSNVPEEINRRTDIKSDACFVCHETDPPLDRLDDVFKRTRRFTTEDGVHALGIISPIYNEPGCAENCHFHPADKKVLGALDMVISMAETDQEIFRHERQIIVMAIITFLATAGIIFSFLMVHVIRPIRQLVHNTERLGRGVYPFETASGWNDEIRALASAISEMGRQTKEKQDELNRQRDEYQHLFEQVPCYVAVVDKNFRLVRYNKALTRQFNPEPGEYCYRAYKGRSEPCDICPVMRTFEDGKSHHSEETGISRTGRLSHWFVQTSPIRDDDGNIAAVMEMSLDITVRKELERKIQESEAKYRVIFDNIPNPVFVLDLETLEILDCNDNQKSVYGFEKSEILHTCFDQLFDDDDRDHLSAKMRTAGHIDQVRQRKKTGEAMFVNIRISPSLYAGRPALLVATSDITRRLLVEQQLVHAGKMTTLGEMATGIAHELNQPLTVIKTASNFIARKVKRKEPIAPDILDTLSEEIDNHVNRASKIINHLREFGRKSDVEKQPVNVNEPLTKSVDMFSQQLKLREIAVEMELAPDLPDVLGDANRLEQVFVNLLINARDAIEEKWEGGGPPGERKCIRIVTEATDGFVQIRVSDNGKGVPESVLDKIFEPFFTTKRVGKGTGLGLSISYGIVQDYEGAISVESTENQGTVFTIRFPVTVPETQTAGYSPNRTKESG